MLKQLKITVSENTINVVLNRAHQCFTLRRHWDCHASPQDLSASMWEAAWSPHTSFLTQGSLTVTYARGDRRVREKICVSAHISSPLLPWNPITSETVRVWCYNTSKTRSSTTDIYSMYILVVCKTKEELPTYYILYKQKVYFSFFFKRQMWTIEYQTHTLFFFKLWAVTTTK